MNPEHAIDLLAAMLRTTLVVVGPLLGVSLVAGVVVGIVQTATQIQEPSISFLLKVTAVMATGAGLGSQLATHLLDYTRASFEAVSQVVR